LPHNKQTYLSFAKKELGKLLESKMPGKPQMRETLQ
jgi:hypothetical protein